MIWRFRFDPLIQKLSHLTNGVVTTEQILKLKRLNSNGFNFRFYGLIVFMLFSILFIYRNLSYNEHEYDFVNPWEFRKLIELQFLKWGPEGQICLQNRTDFLQGLRSAQLNLVEEWNKTTGIFTNLGNNRLKYILMSGLYETRRIPYIIMHYFKSDKETKYYLPFVQRNASCNVFTFGVGLVYDGETMFWRRYPQCEMTAVDPVEIGNKEVVEAVPNARFIQATVSGRNETRKAIIKQPNLNYEKLMTTEHYGITPFLQKYNGNKTIDLLLVDVEGAEYGILPILHQEKHLLPTICQINVEIHYSPKSSGYHPTIAFKKLYAFFTDQTYSIFHIEVFRLHMRVFMVNTASPECIQKFFCE